MSISIALIKDWMIMSKHKFFARLSLAIVVMASLMPANAAGDLTFKVSVID